MAENTCFVHLFPQGWWSIRSSYRKLVGRSLFVYCRMEEEIGKLKKPSGCGPIAKRRAQRRSVLDGRLEFYFGSDWRKHRQPTSRPRSMCRAANQRCPRDTRVLWPSLTPPTSAISPWL